MRFLIDTNPPDVSRLVEQLPDLVAGQLIVPARTRTHWGGTFAMDNSALVSFDHAKFSRMLKRYEKHADQCLFVTCPDVVGSGRRTLEIFRRRCWFDRPALPLCLVLQDGVEDLDIPWDDLDAVFVGGGDPWKDSRASLDLVRTAKILKKHVHCGRVNQIRRYQLFAEAGADTCDGSSVAIHESKLWDIARELNAPAQPLLFSDSAEEPAA